MNNLSIALFIHESKLIFWHTVICFQVPGGARGVMVIVVGNENGDTSSNPGRD